MNEEDFYKKAIDIINTVEANFDSTEGKSATMTHAARLSIALYVNRKAIFDLSEFCRSTPLFKSDRNIGDKVYKENTAVEVFISLLYKMSNAPARELATGSFILLLPIIADKIKQENK